MTYDFALDKKAVISLVAGSVAIGVLLFVAGLLVGKQWLGAESVVMAAATENEGANLPKEPVLNEEAAAPRAAPGAPKSAKPALPALATPKPATETPMEQGAPPAPVSGDVPPAQIISEAGAPNAAAGESAANETAAAAEADYVTVQVGVFLDEKEANHLLQQIERKGYRPTFFSGRDAEARQWYAVRIGVYSDKQQAASAAANFTKQEKLKATVRPVESL